jgi:hypothetical protein
MLCALEPEQQVLGRFDGTHRLLFCLSTATPSFAIDLG